MERERNSLSEEGRSSPGDPESGRSRKTHRRGTHPVPSRFLLMTLYATGLRRAELAHLKVTDIDSQRMVIHVQGGKGRKDRDVMLSAKLLEALREHWRSLRRKPTEWLFPGNRWHTANHPIDTKVAWQACQAAAQRAGIQMEVHPHTLCGIASPLTCWKRVRICAPFKSCWGIAIWKKPPSTSTYPSAISTPPPVPWTRSRCQRRWRKTPTHKWTGRRWRWPIWSV